jgi:alkylation response protein AidB-like acyl-CoA dehydrogenase
MDFDWGEDRLSLRAEAVALGQRLNDGITEDDRRARFPVEKWQQLAEWGYFGLCAPANFGGAGLDPLTGLLVTEGLAEACEDGGLLFSAAVQAWVVIPALLRFATEEQRRACLPGLVEGSVIGALAVTEPECGSDVFAMRTRAVPTDGGWTLSGRKAFVTNGPISNLVLCFAKTGEGGALGGASVFIVESDARGVERGPAQEKMGLRTSPLGELYFDDVIVPDANVLGKVGAGLLVFNETLEWERIWLLALLVGSLQRELDRTRAYARERKAFGTPIGGFQSVANRIVDMKLRLEAGRLLLYRAAWLKAQGRSALSESALAKLWLSESAIDSALDAVQVHGGYGYMTELGLERGLRDAVASRLYSGTSEMQRAIVGRSLGL